MLIPLSACKSASTPPAKEPSFESLDSDNMEDSGLEDITESVQNGDISTAHPKDFEPWSLKSLLMTEKKPEEAQLMECRKELLALSQSLLNPSDLLSSQQKLMPEVSQNRSLYHWCFYYSMMIIDSKLKDDALGMSLTEKIRNFHQEMKALWIVATTLSQITNNPQYFKYLRQRYVKISEDHFARQLNHSPHSLEAIPQKPAGEVGTR